MPWKAAGDGSYDCEMLEVDGVVLAMIEDFGMGCTYPTARNAKTGNLERGGPHKDGVEAKLWAERVAGLHPTKPGDERPPFYYSEGST